MVSGKKLSHRTFHGCFTTSMLSLQTSPSATYSRKLRSMVFCLISFWHKMFTFTRARLQRWKNSIPTISQTFFQNNNMTVADMINHHKSCISQKILVAVILFSHGISLMQVHQPHNCHMMCSHTHHEQILSLHWVFHLFPASVQKS